MKRKLLVIFFIAIFLTIIIYKETPKKINILYIGEIDYLEKINYKKYDRFLYDNITFKELTNSIKNNDYIIFKNKKIYLNQLISKSSLIIIGANNIEYNKYCLNKELNIDLYKKKNNAYKKEISKKISKISSSKIIFLDNYCKNQNRN